MSLCMNSSQFLAASHFVLMEGQMLRRWRESKALLLPPQSEQIVWESFRRAEVMGNRSFLCGEVMKGL